MKAVACVEEHDVLACGIEQSLVHSVVEAVVRFADEAYVVACLVLFDVASDEGKRVVCRAAVDDEVLYAGIVLLGYTLQRALQRGFGIVGDGCYGDEGVHVLSE